jgi:protein-tyrosine-phosphatase
MYKHNKKKNSCIVYEQLLTLAARLASQKKVNEFDFVVAMTKKHFSPTTALGKERKALQNIVEGGCSSEDADAIIAEALEEAKSIDPQRLEKEKVALINEIISKIGEDLFKVPIKNYKVFASAQILFNETRNNYHDTTPEERVRAKKVLKENLVKKQLVEEEVEVDNFTYKVVINKFNQKFGPFINEDQKKILSAWIRYLITEDKNVIEPVLKEKIEKIKTVVKSSLKTKGHKASDYYELLKEADEVMRYCDLVEDLEKSE